MHRSSSSEWKTCFDNRNSQRVATYTGHWCTGINEEVDRLVAKLGVCVCACMCGGLVLRCRVMHGWFVPLALMVSLDLQVLGHHFSKHWTGDSQVWNDCCSGRSDAWTNMYLTTNIDSPTYLPLMTTLLAQAEWNWQETVAFETCSKQFSFLPCLNRVVCFIRPQCSLMKILNITVTLDSSSCHRHSHAISTFLSCAFSRFPFFLIVE